MSTLNKAAFLALYGSTGTTFPDNTVGEISEGDMRQFGQDIADSFPTASDGAYTFPFPQATASGTNTYVATLAPAITSYATGQKYQIRFTNANTGAATLNLNGLGAKAIVKSGSTALVSGDISAGQIMILAYDGTNMQIVGGGGSTPTGFVESVTGDGVDNTDPDNPVLTFPIASEVDNTPAGGIAATNVQAAINELDTEKAPLASPALTGTPTAPTAAGGTNTTQLATTAFVQARAATLVDSVTGTTVDNTDPQNPVVNVPTALQVPNTPAGGIAATTVQAAINELDTEKANLASPTFTGVPVAPTAAVGTNTTQIATTAFVQLETGTLVDLGNVSGTVTVDLSTGRIFKMVQTGNITSFTFSNETIGKQYIFRVERSTTNYTFTFTASKYTFALGIAPVLTDPTANGSSPAKSVDILSAVCYESGRLNLVITPDLQNN